MPKTAHTAKPLAVGSNRRSTMKKNKMIVKFMNRQGAGLPDLEDSRVVINANTEEEALEVLTTKHRRKMEQADYINVDPLMGLVE